METMMLGNTLGSLLFLLNPGPTPDPQPVDSPFATAEEAAEYEARWQGCAGDWNPEQCRADLADEYGLS